METLVKKIRSKNDKIIVYYIIHSKMKGSKALQQKQNRQVE